MFNKYLVIALVLSGITLAGAGYFILDQREMIAEQRVEITKLEGTITQIKFENHENVLKVERLQSVNRDNQIEKAEIKEKAIKDLARVEKIAIRKSKIYERLVNMDFSKTQRELEVLTK